MTNEIIEDELTPTLTLTVSEWNGACYTPVDSSEVDGDADAAIADAIAGYELDTDGDDDADVRVQFVVTDEDDDVIASKTRHFCSARAKQEAMTSWADEGEHTTSHVGHGGEGQWYAWATNGGYGGAHDRMDGSGQWLESYDKPARIDPAEAARLLGLCGLDDDEIAEAMADAGIGEDEVAEILAADV